MTTILRDDVPNHPAIRATPAALADLARHGYSDNEIWSLVVPKRTLARRVADDEPLTVEETDKALRLERIAHRAKCRDPSRPLGAVARGKLAQAAGGWSKTRS